MNSKITFPRLAALLADKSGRSKRFSEDFLRELFSLISERLEAGESVKIKGFGTFRLLRVEPRKSVDVTTGQPIEISGHSKVAFTPAKELAEAVNAPFDAFSAIEIGEDVDIDSLVDDEDIIIQDESEDILLSSASPAESVDDHFSKKSVSESTDLRLSHAETLEIDVVHESLVDLVDSEESDVMSDSSVDSADSVYSAEKDIVPDCSVDTVDFVESDVVHDSSVDGYDTTDQTTLNLQSGTESGKSRRNHTLIICAVCVLVIALLTYILWPHISKQENSDMEATDLMSQTHDVGHDNGISVPEEVEPRIEDIDKDINEDNLRDPVPTAPSDVIVYDTIGKARYLTTMAKDHYGNNKFWPYIYEENKDHIGHPDKIRPGTPIVIPKLSKYGVDPSNPSDVEKATRLGVEIYARYGIQL